MFHRTAVQTTGTTSEVPERGLAARTSDPLSSVPQRVGHPKLVCHHSQRIRELRKGSPRQARVLP